MSPEPGDAGLPRAESGQDVPRWLVVLGAVAAFTLLVALLRYAIDLLGVVFVIILVGFAIRTVSDWLTEGESVSGWAMGAVTMGLGGTVVVGLWLFTSEDLAGNRLERHLPGPVQQTVGWLEQRGWGQRVLLPAPSNEPARGGSEGQGGAAPAVATVSPGRSPDAGGAPVAMAPRRVDQAASASATARTRSAPPSSPPPSPGEAAAAPREASPSVAVVEGAATESAATPVRVSTRTLLSAPAASIVGRSVRLEARVEARAGDRAPGGEVTFRASGVSLGRATVRGGSALLVTLSLELGDHQLSATYDGDAWHLPSTSEAVGHTVRRQ